MKLIHQSIIKRVPALAQQVADFLTEAIHNGAFTPGEILPSETELAKQMDVSRTVVREAQARMKNEGLLESCKGGRTMVAKDLSGLVFRLGANAYRDQNFLGYLYELRAIIEPEAAALAAVRAKKENLALILEKYEKMKNALASGRDGTDESQDFHKVLIDASGNPHLANFVGWVGKKIWSFRQNNSLEHNVEMLSAAQQEHEAIIEAILNREAAKAKEVARQHVINAARRHGLEIHLP